jgi:ribonuclease HI
MPKTKFYAVRIGREPGIYRTWEDCKAQVDGYSGAVFQSFKLMCDAEKYLGLPAAETKALSVPTPLPPPKPKPEQSRKRKSPSLPTVFVQNKLGVVVPAHKYRLYCDGASKGNPGMSGAGAWLFDPDDESIQLRLCVPLGICTNNGNSVSRAASRCSRSPRCSTEAEYHALVAGLEQAIKHGVRCIHVRMDSALVVNQVLGEFKTKQPRLLALKERVEDLRRQFTEFDIAHHYRDQNAVADSLANAAVLGVPPDFVVDELFA